MKQIGMTLKETTADIPDDIDWIIQVEGHTDKRPIKTAEYPSNWELSTARAISVVKFLIKQGWISENIGYPSAVWAWMIAFLILVTLAIVL